MASFYGQVPSVCSEPFLDFLKGHVEMVDFVIFVTELADNTDEVRNVTLEALTKLGGDTSREEWEQRIDADRTARDQLRRHVRLILQTLITRSVDQYLTYLSELLSVIFLSRPETLRSREEVKVEFVLQHDSMDDLVRALAERRVERLAFTSLRDLAGDLDKTLGLALFDSDDQLARATRIVADRNLIIHNRAVVNRTYLRHVPDATLVVGDPLDLSVDDVSSDMDFLAIAAVAVDQRASAKWCLAQVDVPAPGALSSVDVRAWT